MKEDPYGIRDFIKGRLDEETKDIAMSDDMVLSRTRDIAGGVVRAITRTMRSDGFSITCDSTNNTQEMIDSNVLAVNIVVNDPLLVNQLLRGNDNAKTSISLVLPEKEEARSKEL
ncbi:hypothetical protein MPK71_gp055 [Erwinia phage pEa_SNUABM_1]|uniref:Uncharacterized protein n=1 Tax=Erwinia phage pEa_SNUABM_1 TaxID=2869543 RepID=A0AAE8BZE7_9CAUD|nr:hypothetical protein MPK71_gp055 [Erwinia phage pEa_SNUABM_1]QZE57264.1 hypothetical protein pEaSNUABM1_00055 [Erwinia phage pEa_SNUABM_1]